VLFVSELVFFLIHCVAIMSGKIDIILDKPYYLSGEVVAGRADLTVTQHVGHARSLLIKWKGFERTLIENTVVVNEGGESRREKQKHKENKDFFSQTLTLHSFHGDGVAAGKYSFPFTYQLPSGLPGVFYDERKEIDGDKIRAAIVYKVKCWLDMKGKDIKRDHKIIITEPPHKANVPVHEEAKKSFMFARGDLKLKADIAKSIFIPGESIPIRVEVHNESSKKVEALKVKLMRTVKVKAQHLKREHTHEVHRMKFDGVDKKSNKDTVLNFVLADKIYPSTDGKLVDCKYHLDIECDVAMAFDLEVHPKITVALLPAAGQPVWLYDNYGPRAW